MGPTMAYRIPECATTPAIPATKCFDPDTSPRPSSGLPPTGLSKITAPIHGGPVSVPVSIPDGPQDRPRRNGQVHQVPTQALTPSNTLEVKQLQASHVALALKVAALEAKITCTHQLAQETDLIVRGPSSLSERLLQRTLLFTNIAAVKALQACHTEICRNYSFVCAANSIRQISLRSKTSDCSLYDIRLLVSHFMRQEQLRCTIAPSAFYALLSSSSHPRNIEITFETFADVCDALQISADDREAGVYRERKVNCNSGRVLRCVQVLGIDTSLRPGHKNEGTERKILLARSMISAHDSTQKNVHILHQPSTKWSDLDGTWEEGFQLKVEPESALRIFGTAEENRHAVDAETELPRTNPNRRRQSAFVTNANKAFVLQWERCEQSPHARDADSHLVPGALRVCFQPL